MFYLIFFLISSILQSLKLMKKTILLTAIENLISTCYIAPYFNTLLNIPLSLEYLKDCVCGLSYILISPNGVVI